MKPVIIRAAVQGDGSQLTPPKEHGRALRRADDLTKTVVAWTHEALKEAPAAKDLDPSRLGLFLGTSYGPLETNFRFLDTLLDNGEGQASPTLFSHSVHNATAGYLSRIFKILGPAFTVTTPTWPFLSALREAALAIAADTIDLALVVGAEMPSPVLNEAAATLSQESRPLESVAAVTWVLERPRQSSRPQLYMEDIEIAETPCTPDIYLTRMGEEFSPKAIDAAPSTPMACAVSLTQTVRALKGEKGQGRLWQATAPFGRAAVSLLSK